MIKKALTFLNLALITGAIFFSVKIFYTVISARLTAQSIVFAYAAGQNNGAGHAAGRPVVRKTRVSSKDFQAIVDRDLFKTLQPAPKEAEISTSDIENLEKTSLKLKLWGTITGDPDKSYAVIEDTSTHKQQLYRDGDAVAGAKDAKIKLILRRKIVLSVNGKDEILEMQDLSVKGGKRSGYRSSGRSNREAAADGETVSIDRSQINESLKNINNLMRQVRVRPYFEEGKPGGILLSGIQRRSIFEKMGLKSGDIVKGVNGTPIKSVDDALKFYENLKSADSVQLQIKRRGEEKTIMYQIR
ncbi:MAG: PDZ domain-containing protein [Deltaproteobacteria bacterium]|nr:PDZ domain-containing protein [Deltaproteobacteria bacterium]